MRSVHYIDYLNGVPHLCRDNDICMYHCEVHVHCRSMYIEEMPCLVAARKEIADVGRVLSTARLGQSAAMLLDPRSIYYKLQQTLPMSIRNVGMKHVPWGEVPTTLP